MTSIKAPWTYEQVEALQLYQDSGIFHPFTCGNRDDHPVVHGDKGILIPTVRGWICQFCDYTQDWAHPAMFDRTELERMLNARNEMFGKSSETLNSSAMVGSIPIPSELEKKP
jgi:hypothetical protein